jgi:protease-4
VKNFLLGLVVGILLFGLTLVILVFAAIRVAGSIGARPVSVAEGSTLVLRLEGDLPEKLAPEIPLPFLEEQAPMTIPEVWETFRKAAEDPRVKGIILEPRGLEVGWAKLEEIHQGIVNFKKSGKPIVTFLRAPGGLEYYLAAATDRIFLSPEDQLDLKGLGVGSLYLKNTLDKLGVQADVIHAGKYKDAGDMFTRTSMSPETSEVLNQVLDQYYGNLIETVAQGRKQPQDTVRAIIDHGPYTAKEALDKKLVDTLGYEDQVTEYMKGRLKQGVLRRISSKDYLKVPLAASGANHRIALVVGEGEITRGSGNDASSDQGFTSGGFIKLLRQAENDSSIQGVILRIDSPGGDGAASDDILHEAKNLSRMKPVVISMSDLAASGGYFVSITGDPIVAYPNTLTGSIGVIFVRMNLHGLYDKVGVNEQFLTRGRYADIDSSYAPLSDDARAKIAGEIDAFYKSFVSRVAEGRKRTFDQIEPLAQGRVWLGAQAKQNGLVDELGGLDRAVELIKQRAHIASADRVTLVPYPGKRSVLEMLFSRSDDSAAVELSIEKKLKIDKMLGRLPFTALSRGGFMKLMPFSITVR